MCCGAILYGITAAVAASDRLGVRGLVASGVAAGVVERPGLGRGSGEIPAFLLTAEDAEDGRRGLPARRGVGATDRAVGRDRSADEEKGNSTAASASSPKLACFRMLAALFPTRPTLDRVMPFSRQSSPSLGSRPPRPPRPPWSSRHHPTSHPYSPRSSSPARRYSELRQHPDDELPVVVGPSPSAARTAVVAVRVGELEPQDLGHLQADTAR